MAQAHLSFTKKSSDDDSSMPSLRKMVLPTDWGSIRDQLVNFAERQSNSPFEDVFSLVICGYCVLEHAN